MAIDYGDARTGAAVSDISGSIAGEAWVIQERCQDSLAERIAEEARKREVGAIALGCPRNMDGTLGPRAEKTRLLLERLRELGLDVTLWDERLTTVDAHRILSEAGARGAKRKKKGGCGCGKPDFGRVSGVSRERRRINSIRRRITR